ncbi:3-phosphoshikimate 1-carboxyvinyltransferase [Paludibacterium purpuratum]|nr:3-phosphoshikimate 1-carboxyvinyltransferase [Paludibacterium purpuratum]
MIAEKISAEEIANNAINDFSRHLCVGKTKPIHQRCSIPSSKPETQRGIIVASLADGVSYIHNDLRCLETQTMKNVMRALGAEITDHDGYLEIKGIGGKINYNNQILDCLGSGLVFRTATALACTSDTPIIVTGDASLRPRVMKPLFDALESLGARLSCLAEPGKAPVVSWDGNLQGGKVELAGDISSQFITALMFVAPLTPKGIHISVHNHLLSRSYIEQTAHFMQLAGIELVYNDTMTEIQVYPGHYKPINVTLAGDMTSASYFLAMCTLFQGEYLLDNMPFHSMQGERYFLDVVEALGVRLAFDADTNQLRLTNPNRELVGDYHFDVSNCPNIIPTLAALGAFVNGEFKVTGGSITRLHKSNRIKAMVSELKRLQVNIETIYRDDIEDGFVIKGKSSHLGGETLSSWGDHRVFMSLFVASLKMEKPNLIDGFRDVICSFPDFFKQVENLTGVCYE